MALLLTRCRVADFDSWLPKFDAFASANASILSYQVWRGADDPNLVVLLETFESREAADAILGDPGLQDAMADDGVDLSLGHARLRGRGDDLTKGILCTAAQDDPAVVGYPSTHQGSADRPRSSR